MAQTMRLASFGPVTAHPNPPRVLVAPRWPTLGLRWLRCPSLAQRWASLVFGGLWWACVALHWLLWAPWACVAVHWASLGLFSRTGSIISIKIVEK